MILVNIYFSCRDVKAFLTNFSLNDSFLWCRSFVKTEPAVTNANAPPVTLASPNAGVPLNAPAIVTPSVPIATPCAHISNVFVQCCTVSKWPWSA